MDKTLVEQYEEATRLEEATREKANEWAEVRAAALAGLHKSGQSFRTIGLAVGISHARVKQLVDRHHAAA